jgi:SOS response regulatory protein OraA/RecX
MGLGAFGRRPVLSGTGAKSVEDGQFHEAMARAGRLIASHARSEKEIRRALKHCGFDAAVIDRVTERLKTLKLIESNGHLARAH